MVSVRHMGMTPCTYIQDLTRTAIYLDTKLFNRARMFSKASILVSFITLFGMSFKKIIPYANWL